MNLRPLAALALGTVFAAGSTLIGLAVAGTINVLGGEVGLLPIFLCAGLGFALGGYIGWNL